MNVIQRNYNVGERRVGVPGNSGYCILVDVFGKNERGTFEHTLKENHKLLELVRSRQF